MSVRNTAEYTADRLRRDYTMPQSMQGIHSRIPESLKMRELTVSWWKTSAYIYDKSYLYGELLDSESRITIRWRLWTIKNHNTVAEFVRIDLSECASLKHPLHRHWPVGAACIKAHVVKIRQYFVEYPGAKSDSLILLRNGDRVEFEFQKPARLFCSLYTSVCAGAPLATLWCVRLSLISARILLMHSGLSGSIANRPFLAPESRQETIKSLSFILPARAVSIAISRHFGAIVGTAPARVQQLFLIVMIEYPNR
jgi:hypothetical protein